MCFHQTQVEFVEEIQPGEIQVSEWDTPYDNNNGLWNVSQWATRNYYSINETVKRGVWSVIPSAMSDGKWRDYNIFVLNY